MKKLASGRNKEAKMGRFLGLTVYPLLLYLYFYLCVPQPCLPLCFRLLLFILHESVFMRNSFFTTYCFILRYIIYSLSVLSLLYLTYQMCVFVFTYLLYSQLLSLVYFGIKSIILY